MDRRYTSVREPASDGTGEPVGTATSAGEVRGVSSSGSISALGEVVGLPGSGTSISIDSFRAEFVSREYGSLKQSVPTFSGKLEDFPLWKEHLEVFTPMVGCMPSFLVVYDMMIGGVSKDTHHFLSLGFSEIQIETARVAWICLTDSTVNRDLLGRVFATKSLSAEWRRLCDWLLSKTMAGQVTWAVAYDAATMENGRRGYEILGSG